MKESSFSINSDNTSSFEEAANELSKPQSTMTAITPAKFENSFWVRTSSLRTIITATVLKH